LDNITGLEIIVPFDKYLMSGIDAGDAEITQKA